jgi:hypothetical protein
MTSRACHRGGPPSWQSVAIVSPTGRPPPGHAEGSTYGVRGCDDACLHPPFGASPPRQSLGSFGSGVVCSRCFGVYGRLSSRSLTRWGGMISRRALASLMVVVGLLSASASASASKPKPLKLKVTVAANQAGWTEVPLAVGTYTLVAKGRIKSSLHGKTTDDEGLPLSNPECKADQESGGFLVQGLNCFSLVWKLGPGAWTPKEVGSGWQFGGAIPFTLYLGVNDNFYLDNSKAFTATVTKTG